MFFQSIRFNEILIQTFISFTDYNRKSSFDSASEFSVSDADFSESSENHLSYIDEEDENALKRQNSSSSSSDVSESDSDDEENLISQIVSQKAPTRITIKLNVTDKTSTSWDSVS